MSSSYSIALSGMNAYATRIGVSANNVANAQTPNYQPQAVEQTAQAEGGVSVRVGNSAAGTSQAYQPNSEGADEQGMVNVPNVDFAQEAIEQRMDVAGYKANAAVIRTLSAMDKDLLNLKV